MKLLAAYVVGVIFGLGISLSGMANPAKVINFFDIAGAWDPSLAFVMGGAVLITFLGYRWVFTRARPVLEATFQLPGKSRVDRQLASGAVIFGIGWGLAGFCPGGALPVVGTGQSEVLMFSAALIAGIVLTRLVMSAMSSNAGALKTNNVIQEIKGSKS